MTANLTNAYFGQLHDKDDQFSVQCGFSQSRNSLGSVSWKRGPWVNWRELHNVQRRKHAKDRIIEDSLGNITCTLLHFHTLYFTINMTFFFVTKLYISCLSCETKYDLKKCYVNSFINRLWPITSIKKKLKGYPKRIHTVKNIPCVTSFQCCFLCHATFLSTLEKRSCLTSQTTAARHSRCPIK